MISSLFPLVSPILQSLDPETAHNATIQALKLMPRRAPSLDDPRLERKLFGYTFPNPLGVAAGFDKQAEVADALHALGFGFIEVGGVVPLPQSGNPRPRVFRLAADGAVINRYGLNSVGLGVIRERLVQRGDAPALVGVNIGANKDSQDRIADYEICTRALTGLVAFITVNISSPNTPGLRDLQGEAFLDELLARVCSARDDMTTASGKKTSVLLKIAPDITLAHLDSIIATALARGIDGLVVSNTTTARPEFLKDVTRAREVGGLSGKPLFEPSTRLLAEAYLRLSGRIPLVGVGGIDSAASAFAKLEAGASLIQLYTALIYKGPALVTEIKAGIVEYLKQQNITSLDSITGSRAKDIAQGHLYR